MKYPNWRRVLDFHFLSRDMYDELDYIGDEEFDDLTEYQINHCD